MRFTSLVFALCLVLGGCSSTEVVSGSSSLFGVGFQTNGTSGVPQGVIGFAATDFVNVPLVQKQADGSQTALRVRGVCGQENAISVYGSITGNSTVAPAGSPSASLNVGRGLAVGAAAEYLTEAVLASASGGQQPAFTYDCSKTNVNGAAPRSAAAAGGGPVP